MSPWSLRGVRKAWPGGVALDGVDLEVGPGERVALVGASGSGKTTLARIGFGLLRPDAGRALLFGEDPAGPGARARARRAQLLFQSPRAMLHPAMTVGALLRESAALFGVGPGAVRRVLEQVGLSARADALPAQLSGGEQRRAGIARVLLATPALLVADEPTAGLDAALALDLARLLFAPERATVLITHDLPLALATCARVVVLDGGQVADRFEAAAPWAGARAPAAAALLRAARVPEPA